jgi:hypothetical protein
VLGVRHQADDVPAVVPNARDVVRRAVGIELIVAHAGGGAVAKYDETLAFDPRQLLGRRDESPLPVLDRKLHGLTGSEAGRDRRLRGLDPQPDVATHEPKRPIPNERPRQNLGLAKDLEAIADAEHRSGAAGERNHVLHDRGEAGDGAAPQIVAVGEAPRQDHGVDPAKIALGVP